MCSTARAFSIVALTVCSAWAQNVSSSVKGFVLDSSSAAIPRAACVLTNQATGQAVNATSWDDGSFTFLNVLAGKYTLVLKADGFKALTVRDIVVTANETRTLGNLSLDIGEVRDSISVTAETAAVAVQLASAERSGLVSAEQLNNIAIKGRDFFALLSTIPGVVDTYSTPRETTSTNAIAGTFINGGRYNQKNYTIDGVISMNIGANGSIPTEPNMDAISEVKILTSNYQAEYGRHGGGIITVITKSGSQAFHGSGYWNYRHEGLNANSFFNNRTGTSKVPYRYRINGYSIGGPVYIPHKFNTDKSKLFFFFSQEYTGSRLDLGSNFVNTPSELERRGDFSRSFDVSGRLITVNDPLTAKPFPDNIIPVSRLNKMGQSILNFFPLPNYTDPDPRNLYRYNYRSTYSGGNPRRNDVLRFDASLTPTLTMYYRLIQNKDEKQLPWGNWKIGNNFVLSPILDQYPGKGHTVHVTKTFSPTLVNEAMFGYSHALMTSDFMNKELVARSRMGNVPQWFPDSNVPDYAPNVGFGGQPSSTINLSLGVSPYRYSDPVWVVSDNLAKVWNTHTFKVGFHIEHAVIDSQDERGLNRGSFDFSRDVNSPFDSNHSFANALLGNFRSYTETTSLPLKYLSLWNYEWYAQDNWRVTKRLTLDIGIRFYHFPPMADQLHHTAHFNPALYDPKKTPALYMPALDPTGKRVAMDPLTKTLAPAALIGKFVPGSGDFANGSAVDGVNYPAGLYTRPWLAVGPRLGIAYDLFGNGRTALRGGFGMFTDTSQQNPIEGSTGNPPVAYAPVLFYGNLDTFTAGGGVIGPSSADQPPTVKSKLPGMMQFNMAVQHQVWGAVIDVGYVGVLSRHLLLRRSINPIPMYSRFDPKNADPTRPGSPLPDLFFRTYVGYDRIRAFEFMGTSNYNALQISANRRLSQRLQFGVAYTRGKTLGTGGDDFDTISPYFAPRQRNYGPLAFDRPNVFVVNYMYSLPRLGSRTKFAPARWVLDDWQVTGITSFVSGAPFVPGFSTVDGQDITGSEEGARINVIGNPRLSKGERTYYRNFNTAAFARPVLRDFGNAGMGILYGPGVNNWDIAISKRIPLRGEERFLQFRTELFNAWNHTQFSGLYTTARFDASGNQVDPNFGAYSSARTPRIIQFSLRLAF